MRQSEKCINDAVSPSCLRVMQCAVHLRPSLSLSFSLSSDATYLRALGARINVPQSHWNYVRYIPRQGQRDKACTSPERFLLRLPLSFPRPFFFSFFFILFVHPMRLEFPAGIRSPLRRIFAVLISHPAGSKLDTCPVRE